MEGEPRETKRDKLIVEVGSGGFPAIIRMPEIAKNGLFVTVNEDQLISNAERSRRDSPNFSAIHGDAKQLLFPDGTVDELIYSNVFGDPRTMNREQYLHEAARVLVKGGKIIINETYTPEQSRIGVSFPSIGSEALIDSNFFKKFGLAMESFSTNEADTEKYVLTGPQVYKKFPNFQLILKKYDSYSFCSQPHRLFTRRRTAHRLVFLFVRQEKWRPIFVAY